MIAEVDIDGDGRIDFEGRYIYCGFIVHKFQGRSMRMCVFGIFPNFLEIPRNNGSQTIFLCRNIEVIV